MIGAMKSISAKKIGPWLRTTILIQLWARTTDFIELDSFSAETKFKILLSHPKTNLSILILILIPKYLVEKNLAIPAEHVSLKEEKITSSCENRLYKIIRT